MAGLRRWGIRPGQKDVVCLHAFNNIMFPILALGIIGAGGIFTCSNPSYKSDELVHHLRTSKTRFVITEPEMFEAVLEATKESNIAKSNILIFDVLGQEVLEGLSSWETLLSHGEEDWVRFDNIKTAKATEAARFFSSGITGLPKAAMISHYNLIAEHTILWGDDARDYPIKRLIVMPMFHIGVVPFALLPPLKACQVGVIMRRFDSDTFLSNIKRFQITDLIISPPMVFAIITASSTKDYDLKSVRGVIMGAAPLDKDSQMRLQALISENAQCTQAYGGF